MSAQILIEYRASGAGAVCREILDTIPEWFGMAEANAAYVRDAEEGEAWVAVMDGAPAGLMMLKRHGAHAAEIHFIGVRRGLHRHGIGRALIANAEMQARREGRRFVTLKTLGPSREDAGYAETRLFYEALGFFGIEEMVIWGPENPTLVMVKAL